MSAVHVMYAQRPLIQEAMPGVCRDMIWPAACRCSYTNWTSSAHSCDDFYTDRQAINLYKNHVSRVLTRVNTVTGVAYNRDDTIFGQPPALACILTELHACSLTTRSKTSRLLSSRPPGTSAAPLDNANERCPKRQAGR